jgi:hypothetical protein
MKTSFLNKKKNAKLNLLDEEEKPKEPWLSLRIFKNRWSFFGKCVSCKKKK